MDGKKRDYIWIWSNMELGKRAKTSGQSNLYKKTNSGGIVTHGHDFTHTLIVPNHHESSKIALLIFTNLFMFLNREGIKCSKYF